MVPEKYIGENDTVYLEDHSGRVQLAGPLLSTTFLATGVVLALKGKVLEGGVFHISDMVIAGLANQKPVPFMQDDLYVAVCSDLQFSSTEDDIRVELLSDFLAGRLGYPDDGKVLPKIQRLIIAGNSVAHEPLTETNNWVSISLAFKHCDRSHYSFFTIVYL